jgi:hypothetical protein
MRIPVSSVTKNQVMITLHVTACNEKTHRVIVICFHVSSVCSQLFMRNCPSWTSLTLTDYFHQPTYWISRAADIRILFPVIFLKGRAGAKCQLSTKHRPVGCSASLPRGRLVMAYTNQFSSTLTGELQTKNKTSICCLKFNTAAATGSCRRISAAYSLILKCEENYVNLLNYN